MGSRKLELVKGAKTAAVVIDESRAAVIDEFGELKRKEAEFSPSKTKLEALRKVIAGWIPADHPADQPVSFSSKLYTVNVSMQQNQRRVVSYPRLLKLLGWKRFAGVLDKLQGWITNLEKEMGEDDAAKHFVEERTGPRTITAVAKASPAAPDAA